MTDDDDLRMRKTTIRLADGRKLMYFGAIPERPADYPDPRQLDAVHVQSQARWDRLLGEWVVIASHRQDRTFQLKYLAGSESGMGAFANDIAPETAADRSGLAAPTPPGPAGRRRRTPPAGSVRRRRA